MAKYYSPSARGFFDKAIHANIPKDVVEISDADWQALIAEQAKGKRIEPGNNGFPQAVTRSRAA